uniref:Uncharacterized protein n=1 Tax=Arundo donax TaxID=35708 RepID=A0A0A9FCH3_ARUDO
MCAHAKTLRVHVARTGRYISGA